MDHTYALQHEIHSVPEHGTARHNAMTTNPAYTLADLEAARAALTRELEWWENYTGNNPEKGLSDRNQASLQVRLITENLKERGVLPRTPKEELERRLDLAFPDARSRQVVTFEGHRYIRRFWPVQMSRSRKSVMEWGCGWEVVS